jgi:RNA polymerase sigma factor (sigma-70 family)
VRSRDEVPTSDEELLAACLRGENSAWEALVDRYAALIYSIPFKYGFEEADASDVFQSVCVTLLEKVGSIRAPQGLAAWIITTTNRQCLGLIRQRRRELSHSAVDGSAVVEFDPADPDRLPEDELVSLERQQMVRTAIRQLPPNCRELVEALYSDARQPTSYQQLAEGLGMPMNSLGPTRARCLEKLRRLLTAAGFSRY